jgi:ribosomal protein L33
MDLVNWFRKKHSLRCRSCRERFYARTDESKNVMWVNK